MPKILFAAFVLVHSAVNGAQPCLELNGEPAQGGMMIGRVSPGTSVTLDEQPVMVSMQGHFVIGFGRDETGVRILSVQSSAAAPVITRELSISQRQYNLERVDGLPPATVTPEPAALERIRQETGLIVQARSRRDQRSDFLDPFIWPAKGRLSGFYGSQRILNGEPRRPHYGLDIAAPEGTPVIAPAAGVVTLSHPDMYYSGGTLILDHGHGLSSTFLHLSAVDVEAGQVVKQGDQIGRIGATGRASGPHLDWRMNWLNRRLDPQPLVADLDQ